MSCKNNWERIQEFTQNVFLEGDSLFLFGAGLIGALAAATMRSELNIIAICDNDKQKQGTVIEGVPCISPDELSEYQNPFVLISTNKYYQSVHQQLADMQIPHCGLDAYVIHKYFKEFERVYNALDDASKEIYAGILLCRMTGDISGLEQYYCAEQYFCFPKFRCLESRDGIFVDCGAFVGDTVENIIKYSMAVFRKIYAFEPTERTFSALQKRGAFLTDIWALSEGQIVYEQKAVGREHIFLTFRENMSDLSSASLSINSNVGENRVEVVALDEYFAGQEAQNIVFIKADIEGSEWDMLHGAAKIIQRDKPKLAICIYHTIYDFFRIPLYLKELVPEYQFHIRHHSNTDIETVLYCHT